jgi:hypothetical protein
MSFAGPQGRFRQTGENSTLKSWLLPVPLCGQVEVRVEKIISDAVSVANFDTPVHLDQWCHLRALAENTSMLRH